MSTDPNTFDTAAYGGDGWQPRRRSHGEDIGRLWADCRVDSEYAPLRAVLLHRPGEELAGHADPDAAQLLETVDLALACAQHDAIAAAYRDNGVSVHAVAPDGPVPANQMFCADLMFMTPEGTILARPASSVRAGEERHVAARLAALGVPILRTLTGTATFEGADALWLDPTTVLLARGLRTNDEGCRQVAACLAELGVETIVCDLPYGTMHFMGLLRFADRDLAIAWPRRTPYRAVAAMRERGYRVAFLPKESGHGQQTGFNFVTLGPRRILMVAGHAPTQAFLEGLGIDCVAVEASELAKAAGAIGCLSGILARAPVGAAGSD